jgi:hypothetical protein
MSELLGERESISRAMQIRNGNREAQQVCLGKYLFEMSIYCAKIGDPKTKSLIHMCPHSFAWNHRGSE